MKRVKLIVLPMLLTGLLAGCSFSDLFSIFKKKSKLATGEKIYYERILFDTSDESGKNASILLEGTSDKDSVTSVKIGREELTYAFSKKVLTISGESLKKVGPGEKSATVQFKDGKKKSVDIFNATKFIKTAQDFQGIGADKKACEGYYVLANDIDCSSISNFEPIGQYFSETDPTNFYFHGILDGDGYAIKNVTCSYSDSPTGVSDQSYPSNYDVYSGNPKFTSEAHQAGDNVGIFQVIGSSGVVRNISFDNCKVHGRTIVGVIAGNVMGRVENVLINSNCQAKMDTHFYDDDCNVGAAFGIVAGSGNVINIISLTTNVNVLGIYEDYGPDYAGKAGNGWDHPASESDPANWWRFAGVSKRLPNSETLLVDNNGKHSNGVYSVVGKCWGKVENSLGAAFKVTPYQESSYDVAFGHTHTAINKPTSGESDLGFIENCDVYSINDLKNSSTISSYGFSNLIWNIQDGSLPTLKQNIYRFELAK